MATDTMNELRDDNPERVGWYATLICYDSEEGAFPSGCYWSGQKWNTNASVQYWPVVFESKQAATDYAYDHDPEMQ